MLEIILSIAMIIIIFALGDRITILLYKTSPAFRKFIDEL